MPILKLGTSLFAGKSTKIVVTGYRESKVNKIEPSKLKLSSHREPGINNEAKFSNIGKVLDCILEKNVVNGLKGKDNIYCEFTCERTEYHAMCDGSNIYFKEDREPFGYYGLIPLFLYQLSRDDELKNSFIKIRDEYMPSGAASEIEVAFICDSFYYGYAKKQDSVSVELNSGIPATASKAYNAGELNDFDEFKGIPVPALSIKRKKIVPKKESNKNNYDYLKGSDIIHYAWSEEQKNNIPSLAVLEDFVPSKQFFSIKNKILYRTDKILTRMDTGKEGLEAIDNDYVNISLVGRPGTGKTTLAYALGAALGVPVYTITFTKSTDDDEVQGKNKVVDGKIGFVHTEFLKAYQHGGIAVLEEINLSDPAVTMGSLGQAIEKPFILMEDGYIPVRRHPMFIAISTMNVGTNGSKMISQPLSSRFKHTYMLNDPSKDDCLKMLDNFYPKRDVCEWVYNCYGRILNYMKDSCAEDLCLNITLRSCIGALQSIEEGEDPKDAILSTMIGKIAESDLELAEAAYDNVVETMVDIDARIA